MLSHEECITVLAQKRARDIVQHLLDTHHKYVKTTIPLIESQLQDARSSAYPLQDDLAVLSNFVLDLFDDLKGHLMKEEEILFPYICQLEAHILDGAALPESCFYSVEQPIFVMESEHAHAQGIREKIESLTQGYSAPDCASAELTELYSLLKEFMADLVQHIDKEDTILHPLAKKLEQESQKILQTKTNNTCKS